MSAVTIARLKITLDDVKPVVLRRVEAPFDIRLDRLHLTIQAAMAGPTAICTRSARAVSVGVRPIPTQIGPATSSMLAELGSATSSKRSAQRR
jgi:hypothetical protein